MPHARTGERRHPPKTAHCVCLFPNVAPPLLPSLQNPIRSRRASSDPPRSRGCASPGSGDTRCAGLDGKNSTEPQKKHSKTRVLGSDQKHQKTFVPSRIQRLTQKHSKTRVCGSDQKHVLVGLTKNTETHLYHLGVRVRHVVARRTQLPPWRQATPHGDYGEL